MSIISKVKELQFPSGQYVVIGSGIMEALGIREAQDVDIAVTSELYNNLYNIKEWHKEMSHDKIYLKRDNVEIIPQLNWDKYSTTTKEAILSSTLIKGVSFMNLVELKKFKMALGREKDFKDIELIDKYLNN